MAQRSLAPASQAAPSARLVQVLRTYCGGLSRDGIEDLQAGLSKGQYPWLQSELRESIRDRRSRTELWRLAVNPSEPSNGRPPSDGQPELRALWSRLFPDVPFPKQVRTIRAADSPDHR